MERPKLFLFLSLLFSIILLIIRIKVTHSFFYLFLIWNLFLAAIPLIITVFISNNNRFSDQKIIFLISFIIWLLFLPNAPYIITDFLHFKWETKMPYWFDVLMLTTFALNGLILGLKSMMQMQELLAKHLSTKKIWLTMTVVCFMCGFGIYIGRFLRYNSWDIMVNPVLILNDITDRILYPLKHLKTWGMTFGFGTLLWILFGLLKEFSLQKANQ